jgi:hypothetical protein
MRALGLSFVSFDWASWHGRSRAFAQILGSARADPRAEPDR